VPHGSVEAFAFEPRLYRVTRIRRASRETSALAIVGRFVFTPEFFDHLATVPVGTCGEIELAEALQAQLAARPMFACELAGERFDCRSKPGLLSATLHFGLRHPVLAETFAAMASRAATAALRSPAIAADRALSLARTVNDWPACRASTVVASPQARRLPLRGGPPRGGAAAATRQVRGETPCKPPNRLRSNPSAPKPSPRRPTRASTGSAAAHTTPWSASLRSPPTP